MKTLWDTPEIPRCLRCHKRMEYDVGEDDDGRLEAVWVCYACQWHTTILAVMVAERFGPTPIRERKPKPRTPWLEG